MQINKSIISLPKNECTGCGCCDNICPVGAIQMKSDSQGFLMPEVDNLLCTNCGLCAEHCPSLNPLHKDHLPLPLCYAVWADEDTRLQSSSGGMFALASDYVLGNGGYVCGAAYTDDFMVEHIIISDKNDLRKLQGSKYLQSDTKKSYARIKELLDDDRQVLFSGCPCQVAGLYAYLGSGYNRLFTLDLICHGVPSPKVFKKYINEYFKDKNIESIDFRDKSVFGWSSSMNVRFSDGTYYRDTHEKDSYYRAFLPCLSLRLSCSTCKFTAPPRTGDLSIGDFWGIGRYRKELNDNKGTSLVLINNNKGKKFFNRLKSRMELSAELPMEHAIPGNPTLLKPFHSHPARKRFFSELDRRPLKELVDDALRFKYDVGIADLWFGINYGSILTAYALYKLIESMGFSPLMLNKPKELWSDRYADKNTIAGRFIYPRCNVSNVREPYYKWEEINAHCDIFITGSDVVWNRNICDYEYFFFLDFASADKKKIAFASSFGGDFVDPRGEAAIIKHYLQKFDAVSVREEDAVSICERLFGVKAEQVLDPVFLCGRDVYEEAIGQSALREMSAFLSAYILGANTIKRDIILQVADSLNLELRIILNPNNYKAAEERLQYSPTIDSSPVEDWLYYIKNCEFFIGDSFHGLCFSIVFEKQFIIVLERNTPSENRFISLMTKLGLTDRLVYQDDDPEMIAEIIACKINYSEVYSILDKEKAKSLAWLNEAIIREKSLPANAITLEEHFNKKANIRFDILERRIADFENRLKTLES